MYVTYKITNEITQKFYYGSHKTDNINDDYWGSGRLIKESIKKYGKEAHKKEIIGIFETRKESIDLEHKLIKESKLNSQLLNRSTGGQSFDYINENIILDRRAIGALASHEWSNKEKELRIKEYNKHPNKCNFCGKPLSYKKRKNTFCSSSCSAKYNNPTTKKKDFPDKFCKYCGAKLERGAKKTFCNNKCSGLYQSEHRTLTELQSTLLKNKEKIQKLHESMTYREIAKLYNTSASSIKDLLKGRFERK